MPGTFVTGPVASAVALGGVGTSGIGGILLLMLVPVVLVPLLVMAVAAPRIVRMVRSGRGVGAERRQVRLDWAAQHGLGPAPSAAALTRRWSGPPFGVGSNRMASGAVTGRREGREVHVLDYAFVLRDERGYTRVTVVTVGLPAALRPLSVTTQRPGANRTWHLGQRDIDLDNPAFNDAFVIDADDDRFAYDVLHQRAQEHLLAGVPHGWQLRIEGSDVITWGPPVQDPQALEAQLRWATGFVDLVPRFVWQAHGHDPAGLDAADPPAPDRQHPDRPAPRKPGTWSRTYRLNVRRDDGA